jgi:hypothetical protein
MIDAETYLESHRRRAAELHREAREAGLAARVRKARRAAAPARPAVGPVDCGRLAPAG